MRGRKDEEEDKSNGYIILKRDVARKGGAKWFKPVYIAKAEDYIGSY